MPFTLSHAAAVLPLARTRLPPAALVAGSLAPDLPYYLPLPLAATTTHGVAGLGADVLLGGVALAVYAYALRAPLYALAGRAPAPPARAPGPRGRRYAPRGWPPRPSRRARPPTWPGTPSPRPAASSCARGRC